MIGVDKVEIIDLNIAIDWAAFNVALPGDNIYCKTQGKSSAISGLAVNRLAWRSPTKGKAIDLKIQYNEVIGRCISKLSLCPATILRTHNLQPVMSAEEFLQAYEAARCEMAADGILLPQTINPEANIASLEINTNLTLLEPFAAYSKSLLYILKNIKLKSSEAEPDSLIGTTLERRNKSIGWKLYDKNAELKIGFTADTILRIECKLKNAKKVQYELKDNSLLHILQNWHIIPEYYAAAVQKQILKPVADAVKADIKAHADQLRTYLNPKTKFTTTWLAETQTIFDAEHMVAAYTQVMTGRIGAPTLKSQKSLLRRKLQNRNQQLLRPGATKDQIIGQQELLNEILGRLKTVCDRVPKRITMPMTAKPPKTLVKQALGSTNSNDLLPR